MGDRAHRLEIACRIADALTSAEPARRRGEALDLVEVSELPTAVLDVASRTPRVANAAWRKLFGTRDAYAAIPGVDEVVRTGATIHVAELALDLGGRPAYGAAMLRASRDDRGATTNVIAVCADITDEVVARQLAVDADALVWSGPCVGDPDYGNSRWSAYAECHAGWLRAVHPGDVATCSAGLAWVIRERGSIEVEARLRRANGDQRWHRVRFAIASSGARWFATARDVHDVRDAEAERNDARARARAALVDAERAHRLKDQFLVAVSHELQAPLMAMLLWDGVLRDDSADAELRARARDAIRDSARAQSRVIGDLVDVARATAGKLCIDLRPVEIEPLVQGALDEIAPVALAKQVALDRRRTLPAGALLGDAPRLHRVLVHVLASAVESTDPGGRVAVGIARRGRSIAIEVEDGGPGVAPEWLSGMFEPLAEAGLDLGLGLAKQIVELHHGTIAASSAGPGRGTTLTLVLPAAAARHIATPAQGVARAPGLDHARVLVIDDDPRVRDALGLLLDRAGAVVDTADCAAAARARIAHAGHDALVCDIAMPIEDGYSFIRGLRASGDDIAAIALTAHATETDVARALAAGFDRHLAKPIEFACLVASIDELIVARRAARRAP